MKVIKPTNFVEATHLVSTNAVETYAAYSAGTTYAKGARVDYGTHIYESLVNNNTGNTPTTSPTYWVLVGPDNVHAMFDDQISTATVSTTPLIVVMTPGLMNSIALLGLIGSQAVVAITDGAGGPTIYSRTVNLDGSYVYDWYMYFFEPFTQIGEVVLTDIPPYSNSRMTFTLSGTGTVAIGQLSFGTFYELGDAEYGATAGIIDYSRKDTDEFGATTFVQRAFSKRMTARLMLDAMQMNKVQRVLSDIRATPAVWIGAEGEAYSPLVIYGFYRDFTIDVAYPTKSYCSLEIEGLI
jgi:hypothetical protein